MMSASSGYMLRRLPLDNFVCLKVRLKAAFVLLAQQNDVT